MGIKLKRAIRLSNVHPGPVTVDAIMNQIPDRLSAQLSSGDLALVIKAVDAAYHNGKAASGAEMVDDNAVWINKLDRAIEWNEVGAVYEYKDVTETSPDGYVMHGKVPVKTKDGVMVVKFCD